MSKFETTNTSASILSPVSNEKSYGLCTGEQIIKMHDAGLIDISDFNKNKVNPNSYNLHLANKLLIYDNPNKNTLKNKIDRIFHPRDYVLDAKINNPTIEIIIPEDGYLLKPGVLYLGKTNEYTVCTPQAKAVPMLDGRSSIGRLGIFVHVTAGFGDVGFSGNWTLEIMVVHPTIIYPNMEICQLSYYTTCGDTNITYNGKYQCAQEIGSSQIFKEL